MLIVYHPCFSPPHPFIDANREDAAEIAEVEAANEELAHLGALEHEEELLQREELRERALARRASPVDLTAAERTRQRAAASAVPSAPVMARARAPAHEPSRVSRPRIIQQPR